MHWCSWEGGWSKKRCEWKIRQFCFVSEQLPLLTRSCDSCRWKREKIIQEPLQFIHSCSIYARTDQGSGRPLAAAAAAAAAESCFPFFLPCLGFRVYQILLSDSFFFVPHPAPPPLLSTSAIFLVALFCPSGPICFLPDLGPLYGKGDYSEKFFVKLWFRKKSFPGKVVARLHRLSETRLRTIW